MDIHAGAAWTEMDVEDLRCDIALARRADIGSVAD
jgi:hypothetical protein